MRLDGTKYLPPVSERNKTVFREISEVALRVNQESDDIAETPVRDYFLDGDGKIREVKCPTADCPAIYAIGYPRIYQAKKFTFDDLSDKLLLRLEEDHAANRKHRSLIPLRWSDTTRKRKREQKPEETKPDL